VSASPALLRLRVALVLLLALSGTACAGVQGRQRLSRALAATGAIVGVTGVVLVAGCVPDDRPGACSAGPQDGSVRIGVPVFAIGAALITAGMLVRHPSKRPRGPNITRHAVATPGDNFGPGDLQGY